MSYSQNNEQEIIFNYFKNLPDFEWRFGTLLDIGANDGKTLSNSLALIESGWNGLLVEASPKAFERLEEQHNATDRQVQLINVAVGSYDGTIEFNESGELLGKGDVALVSSTRQDEMDRWVSLNMPFEKITVPVVTFATLMDQSIYGEFDLVSVDIEGMEPEVVPQIDFTKLCTKMAIIEWNGKNAELYDGLLLAHGLKLIHFNAENRIYAR
jgi:FkbM family methyltransferase